MVELYLTLSEQYHDVETHIHHLQEKDAKCEQQYHSIEKELKILNLKSIPKYRKRYFNKKLVEFKKYLKDELSLISEGYYAAIGIGLGMSLGIAIGASFGDSTGIALGLSFGMIIGLVIGRNKDAEAEKQGRVLKTKL